MAKQQSARELQRSWLYDTFRFTPGIRYETIELFTKPVGSSFPNGTIKTFSHTNMTQPGMLEFQTFIVHGILLNRGYGFPKKDIPEFTQSYCGFMINQKVYPAYFPINFLLNTCENKPIKPLVILTGKEEPITIQDIVDALKREKKSIIFDGLYRLTIGLFDEIRFDILFDDPGYVPTKGFDLMIVLLGTLSREIV